MTADRQSGYNRFLKSISRFIRHQVKQKSVSSDCSTALRSRRLRVAAIAIEEDCKIPKAGSVAHVRENLLSTDVELSHETLTRLDSAFPAHRVRIRSKCCSQAAFDPFARTSASIAARVSSARRRARGSLPARSCRSQSGIRDMVFKRRCFSALSIGAR